MLGMLGFGLVTHPSPSQWYLEGIIYHPSRSPEMAELGLPPDSEMGLGTWAGTVGKAHFACTSWAPYISLPSLARCDS